MNFFSCSCLMFIIACWGRPRINRWSHQVRDSNSTRNVFIDYRYGYCNVQFLLINIYRCNNSFAMAALQNIEVTVSILHVATILYSSPIISCITKALTISINAYNFASAVSRKPQLQFRRHLTSVSLILWTQLSPVNWGSARNTSRRELWTSTLVEWSRT